MDDMHANASDGLASRVLAALRVKSLLTAVLAMLVVVGGAYALGTAAEPLLDTKPPVTTIVGVPAEGTWVNHDVTFSLTATDTPDGSIPASGVAETYYQLAGASTQELTPYTSEVTVTAQGTTSVDYLSVDLAGNRETTRTATILIDKAKPTTTSDAKASYFNDALITLTPSDTGGSGLAATYWSLGSATGPWTAGVQVPLTAAGSYTLWFYSTDTAGNAEDVRSASFEIVEDTTAPVTEIAFTHPAGYVSGQWTNQDVTFTLTAQDNLGGSGVAETWYRLGTSGDYILYDTPVTVSTAGETTVQFYATDALGNPETAKSATILIDKAKPTTTSDAQASYFNDALITLTPSDTGGSGLAATYWSLGSATGPWTAGVQVPLTAAGTYTLWFYSTDTAGNAEDARSASFQIVEDTTAPVTSIDFTHPAGYASGEWTNQDVTFTLTAQDNLGGSGVASVWYRLGTSGDYTLYETGVTVSTAGETTVQFYATDALGNPESPKSATILIDKAKPTTTSDAQASYFNDALITLTPSDTGGSGLAATYWSLGSATGPWTAGTQVPLTAAGSYTLWFYSTDTAGNAEDVRSASFQIGVDTHAPTTTIDGVPGAWTNENVTFSLSATDTPAGSGVAETWYELSGAVTQAKTPYDAPVDVTSPGVTTVTFWSADNVGLEEAGNTATIRIDKAKPTTTSNAKTTYHNTASITLSPTDEGDAGVQGTYYRFGGSGPWKSGKTVSASTPGSYQLQFYSTDAAGNAESVKSASFSLYATTYLSRAASPTALKTKASSTTFSAVLRIGGSSGKVFAAQDVQIQASANGTSGWTVISRKTTDGTGKVSLTVTPGKTTYYRAVYAPKGGWYRGTSSSAVKVSVPVTTYLSVKASPTSLKAYGDATTISGYLRRNSSTGSGVAGQTVYAQAYVSGAWKTMSTLKTSTSGYVSWRTIPRSGTTYRLRYSGVAGAYEAMTSGKVRVIPKLYFTDAPRFSTYTHTLGKTHKVWGYLKPKHTTGSTQIKVKAYLRTKQSDGTYKYVYKKTYSTKISNPSGSNYSKYTGYVKLPSKGKWRLRAHHAADSLHGSTYTPYRYVRVE